MTNVSRYPEGLGTETGISNTPISGKNFALLIANQNYDHVSPLHSPGADCRQIRNALEACGFLVVVESELKTSKDFADILDKYIQRAKEGRYGGFLLHYAGHGCASEQGINYLLPTTADPYAKNWHYDAFPIGRLIEHLEKELGDRNRLVLIDACRKMIGSRSDRDVGLFGFVTQPQSGTPSVSTVLYFSTQYGKVAADRYPKSDLSPFATVFVDILKKTRNGSDIVERLNAKEGGIRNSVAALTEDEQVPQLLELGKLNCELRVTKQPKTKVPRTKEPISTQDVSKAQTETAPLSVAPIDSGTLAESQSVPPEIMLERDGASRSRWPAALLGGVAALGVLAILGVFVAPQLWPILDGGGGKLESGEPSPHGICVDCRFDVSIMDQNGKNPGGAAVLFWDNNPNNFVEALNLAYKAKAAGDQFMDKLISTIEAARIGFACDEAAGRPYSPDLPPMLKGVYSTQINTVMATEACRKAVDLFPDVARYKTWMGRANYVQGDSGSAKIYYDKSIAQKDTNGLVALGNLYWVGGVAGKGKAEAVALFRQAAEKNNSWGIWRLGDAYAEGWDNQEPNYGEAKMQFDLAVENGNISGLVALGNLYWDGKVAGKGKADAVKLFQEAAGKNDSWGMRRIGDAYVAGWDNEKPNYQKAEQEYKRAIEKGDSDGLVALGNLYWDERVEGKGKKEAVGLFQQAAGKDNSWGMRRLGDAYVAGWDNEKPNYQQAEQEYKRAIEKGYTNGLVALGSLYWDGRVEGKGKKESVGLFQQAAGKDNSWGMRRLGDAYVAGWDNEKPNHQKAEQEYKRATENGDGDAFVSLGKLYWNGHAGSKADAYDAFKKAHDAGVGVGTSWLAWIAKEGWDGRAPDYLEAERLYKDYAKLGKEEAAEAASHLGWMYWLGQARADNDSIKNYQTACKNFEIASDEGLSGGMVGLAECFEFGRDGRAKNIVAAKELYLKAAEARHGHAMYRIGYDAAFGDLGGERNLVVAVDWFNKSAALGWAAAMYRLGEFYRDGNAAVTRDDAKARGWYDKIIATKSESEPYFGEALSSLAWMYENNRGDGKSDLDSQIKAQELYERAAKLKVNPNSYAMRRLGYRAQYGDFGGVIDLMAALDWFEKAKLAGDAEANNAIGKINLELAAIENAKPDQPPVRTAEQQKYWEESTKGFRESADSGNAEGQYRLAMNLIEDVKYGEALRLLVRSASQGHPKAIYNLATFQDLIGEGALQLIWLTESKRVFWLEKAASLSPDDIGEIEYANAAHLWSEELILRDPLSEKDIAESHRLLEKSAAIGWPDAMRTLADQHLNGDHRPKNVAEALKIYDKLITEENSKGMLRMAELLSDASDPDDVPDDYNKAADLFVSAFELGCCSDLEEAWLTQQSAISSENLLPVRVAVQEKLIEKGLLEGSADGVFGEKTLGTLKALGPSE